MDRAEIEKHRIARLHFPLKHLHALFLVWIRRVTVSVSVPVKIALIGPVDGFYPFLPTV